jgi:hypothetical protein
MSWTVPRAVLRGAIWCVIFSLQLVVAVVVVFFVRAFIAAHVGQAIPREIRIDGNAVAPPRLEFACDQASGPLQSFFSSQSLIDDLRQLGAGITLALVDLSAGRASVVRRLNENGIPVTAWLALPQEQGYYVSAANAPETAARFAAFEKWTGDYGLRWAGVGLDIEPSLQDFGAVKQGHLLKLVGTLVRRCLDTGSVDRPRNAYAVLIQRIQADGYRVDTYQFPFIADERKVHSHLLERLFGIVDVHGNREVFMTYTNFNRAIDSALISAYGPEAQLLAVGSTAGDSQFDARFGPLNWNEFSRDVIAAGHFSEVVGVYNLEGSVRQGFLSRLKTMNWGQSVTVPAEANRKAAQLRARIQAALWTGSRLPYLTAAIAILDGWLLWRKRNRHRASRTDA